MSHYSKCAFFRCRKTSRDVSLFRFPVSDKERLAVWIRHSGNIFLDSLTQDELSRRFICADHFHESSIHKGNQRNRLIGPAIPVPYKDSTNAHASASVEEIPADHEDDNMELGVPSPEVLKVRTPKKFYQKRKRSPSSPIGKNTPSSSEIISTPTYHVSRRCSFEEPKRRMSRRCLFENKTEDTPKTKRMKTSARSLIKTNRALQAKFRRLREKQNSNKNLIDINQIESEVAKTLVLMQTRKKNDRSKWSKDAKKFCLSLFYKSPSAYIYMQRQGVRLAATSTLRRWLLKTSTTPGMCKSVFKNLKQRFENSTTLERACVLSFDEMAIMANLEYSIKEDLIEGFEDYGLNHRSPKLAKYALVFVLRGLYKNWKMPIAYYLSASNVKTENLQLFVKAILNKLFENELLPKAVVCDQMSTNQKLFKNLGVTKSSPFFYCNGKKIYALFDVPHLIKNVRNNLLQSDFLYNKETISFKDIKETYDLDQQSTKSRALTKITESHIRPNSFQKMSVSLATQIFSNSVAAAIRTAIGTGELKSESANATAKFVVTVNNLFDGLNSKKKYDKNPYKFALSKTASYVNASIKEGIAVFDRIEKKTLKSYKNGGSKEVLTRPPCFDGIVQTSEAVLQLFNDETADGSIDYIVTNKLNQDVCENLFARLRQKGGSNRNPTAKQLRTIFRSSIVNSMIKLPSSKNCESDNETFIDVDEPTSTVALQSQCEPQRSVPSKSSSSPARSLEGLPTELPQQQCSSSARSCNVTLEQCSVAYFSGYLANHCLKNNNNCKPCLSKLIKKEVDLQDESQLLILHKSYNINNSIKLKMPTEELIAFVSCALDGFNLYFHDIAHVKNLKSRLLKAILQHLSTQHGCEAQKHFFSCNDHLTFIINHMLIVKLHFYCKNIKKNILENKMHPKLRILKNK